MPLKRKSIKKVKAERPLAKTQSIDLFDPFVACDLNYKQTHVFCGI